MADEVRMTFKALWEDELRTAAKLLKHMHDCPEGQQDEYARRAYAALEACNVALWGVDDDCALVMVGSSKIKATRRGKRDE